MKIKKKNNKYILKLSREELAYICASINLADEYNDEFVDSYNENVMDKDEKTSDELLDLGFCLWEEIKYELNKEPVW